MSNVRILISNPEFATVSEEETEIWIVGTRPEKAVDAICGAKKFIDAVDVVENFPGEYTLFGFDDSGILHAHRGITSSFDVFYTEAADGTIVVGDHFRDVLAEVPREQRTVPDSVGPDQLLFGTRPNATYVEEVDRLGHGETLTWQVESSPERVQTERLSTTPSIGRKEAIDRLDTHFDEILCRTDYDRPVTMLSGGVDSTLIASYLDTPESVSGSITSPEFEFEEEYATRAADLLGTDHSFIRLAESDYIKHIEQTVDRTGQPLQHQQAVLMNATISQSPHHSYFNGQLADGLLGTSTARVSEISWRARHLGALLSGVSSKAETVDKNARQLRRTVDDPAGPAMNFVIHSDQNRVKKIFGSDAVAASKRRRFEYTKSRVDIPWESGYGAHMHVGHLIDFFQDNTASPWRHAAHAHGNELHTPFGEKRVVETALALSPKKRYTHRFKVKHLLKSLLKSRLPEYDTEKPKGASGLPTERYNRTGPLKNAFEKYNLPDFIPNHKEDIVLNDAGHIKWYSFSYAVWRDRILRNDQLGRLDSTSVIERP
ncbi:asparagine synthase C-terminal domain-containing protein [Halobacterium salinarum]|uniref:asparagine synthase C-terminal domain-containing protein n=1 Tax=Halobacterium salinarum TaxID=2242 RepID=UPI00255471C9|nr:asparagine synthase C-terminal domain-containing protein [Halobacterium salinarum]MDL0135079.1 asparagine synthase C-terminal domain-containing protein [Halobacterium salinarum]